MFINFQKLIAHGYEVHVDKKGASISPVESNEVANEIRCAVFDALSAHTYLDASDKTSVIETLIQKAQQLDILRIINMKDDTNADS